jgi:asparagine synthase (glutamine-hydrolysing)
MPLHVRTVTRLAQVLRSLPDIGLNRWVQVFTDDDMRTYCTDTFLDQLNHYNPFKGAQAIYRGSSGMSPLEKGITLDIKTWLPDDLLMKVDKMTMAHSLEARAPYLNHNLVEFMAGLHLQYKVSGLQTKTLLKRIARKYIPDAIVFRLKQGLDVPLDTWLLHNFRSVSDDIFTEKELQSTGLFNATNVIRDWEVLKREKRALYSRRLWLVFCLMVWLRRKNLGF